MKGAIFGIKHAHAPLSMETIAAVSIDVRTPV
jgi:hypothetical protein